MYLESLDEAPTPAGSTVAAFSLSPALLTAPPKLTPPAEFVLRLAHDSATYPDVLKQRVAAIKKDGRGTVFTYADAKSTRVRDIANAADLWKLMLSGALWLDESRTGLRPVPPPQPAETANVPVPTPDYPLILIAADSPPPHGSPLLSKLYRESGLRRSANAATVNPETGRDHSITDGCRAIVKTPVAAFKVQVAFDPAVMPGVIEMAMVGQAVSPANMPASIRKA
jgi:anaerobic selenocysteine-containing dehydrogenase